MAPRSYVVLPRRLSDESHRIDAEAFRGMFDDAVVACDGRTASWDGRKTMTSNPHVTVPLIGSAPVTLPVFYDQSTETTVADSAGVPAGMRVLVVGAGGIGCELLKNLVLLRVPHVEVIDMDSIDETNLNRQFLFSSEHVGQPKSIVAAAVVNGWGRSDTHVVGHEGNIKHVQRFDDAFFASFHVVINGLDNVSARKHVNRLCIKNNVPLVESGTMGYNGQVQPIVRGVGECYDCRPKPNEQKTFAVCTIHARPTTLIHCVHYAKELHDSLFGNAVEPTAHGAAPPQKSEFESLVVLVSSHTEATTVAEALYTNLFVTKITEMLSSVKQWPIKPPRPLPSLSSVVETTPSAEGELSRDARAWYTFLRESLEVLLARGRGKCHPFNKDDTAAVRFVAAIANLRALTFHISPDTEHQIKTVAGNIVPAIASTNAIIAACAVETALRLARGVPSDVIVLRHVAQVRRRIVPQRGRINDHFILHRIPLAAPNPKCIVCSANDRTVNVRCNAARHTLGSFVHSFLLREMGLVAPTVDLGPTTLYEQDEFMNLAPRPLTQWVPLDGMATPLTVGDLHQSVEWTVNVAHSAELDEASFVTDVDALSKALSSGAQGPNPTQLHHDAEDAEEGAVVAYHPSMQHQRKQHRPES